MRFFETKFLEEANEFISQLDQKLSEKSSITLISQNKQMTQYFSKNYKTIFGSLERNMQVFK